MRSEIRRPSGCCGILGHAEPPAARGDEPDRARRQPHRAVPRAAGPGPRARQSPRPPLRPGRAPDGRPHDQRVPPRARDARPALLLAKLRQNDAEHIARCDDGPMAPSRADVGGGGRGGSSRGLAAGALAVAVVTAGDLGAQAVRPGAQPRRALRAGRSPDRASSWGCPGRSPSRSRACSPSTGSSCRRCTRSRSPTRATGSRSAVFVATGVVVSELAARHAPPGARVVSARRDRDLAARARRRQRGARPDRGRSRPRPRGGARDDRPRARRPTATAARTRTSWRRVDAGWGRSISQGGAAAAPARAGGCCPALASLLGVADRPRAPGGRGVRGRGAAAQRRAEDRSAARRQPRPAHAR